MRRASPARMRSLLAAVVLLVSAAPAFAASYAAAQAAAHIGETATIEGPVSGTHVDARSGAGFIDMGGRYPNQTFTGFIPRGALGRFGDLSRYEGKSLGITGTVRDYRGRPEIILSDPGQVHAQ